MTQSINTNNLPCLVMHGVGSRSKHAHLLATGPGCNDAWPAERLSLDEAWNAAFTEYFDREGWTVAAQERVMTAQEPDDGKTTIELAAELTEATNMRQRIERAVVRDDLLDLVSQYGQACDSIDPAERKGIDPLYAEIVRRIAETRRLLADALRDNEHLREDLGPADEDL